MSKIVMTEEASAPSSPAANNMVIYCLDGDADASKTFYSKNPGGNIRVMANIPPATATHDLGSSSLKWRDGFFSRDVSIGDNLDVTSTSTFGGIITVTADAHSVFAASSSNTSAGIAIGRKGTGDGYIQFTEGGVADHWRIGHDASDSDKFKFSSGNALGTNDRLVITAAGAVTIAAGLTVTTGGLTVSAGSVSLPSASVSPGALDVPRVFLYGLQEATVSNAWHIIPTLTEEVDNKTIAASGTITFTAETAGTYLVVYRLAGYAVGGSNSLVSMALYKNGSAMNDTASGYLLTANGSNAVPIGTVMTIHTFANTNTLAPYVQSSVNGGAAIANGSLALVRVA